MAVANRERRGGALHRLTGLVRGVNWRPMLLADELTVNLYACCVCYVLPSTTVVLPCSHCVCRQCHVGCLDEDGRSVCPMDGEPFDDHECQELKLPARKKRHLKAYCWNEPYGCNFVGPIAVVLEHYEQSCAFHVFPCRRCGEIIKNDMLAAHYISRCKYKSSSASLPEVPRRVDDAAVSGGVNRPGGSGSEEELMRLSEMKRIEDLECMFDALVGISEATAAQLDQTEQHIERLEM
ncbi:uncharacterized protein LOC142796318 [Rhipicephalus microplus]|uniref:uncharacterized protein LOC142796318 n=1 Tax=Rhipicephalus microplus TaxID=6941 RepID=UPI003F6B21F0